jgi:hypothetical protein
MVMVMVRVVMMAEDVVKRDGREAVVDLASY